MSEVIDHATPPHPDMRLVTAGTAVTARVLNGLGFVTQPLDLVPHVFPQKPIARRVASGIDATPLHEDTWGRAVETR